MVKFTNYQNGKIYVITSKIDRTIKYVGSTCNSLSMRLAHHRGASKLDKNKNFKIYQYFNENSWTNAEISLLEACPCKSKNELLMKEREFKDKLNPSLNMVNPYTTDDEKKIQIKQYYDQHAEELKQQMKQYYDQHAEEMKQQMKQYREQNKEEIKQQNKQYYENRLKIDCPNCGNRIKISSLEKHQATQSCKMHYNHNEIIYFRTTYAF